MELPEEHTLGLAHSAAPQTGKGFGYKMHSSPAPMPGPPPQSWHSPPPPPQTSSAPPAALGAGNQMVSWCWPCLLCGCVFPVRKTQGPPGSLPPPGIGLCRLCRFWAVGLGCHRASAMGHTCACRRPLGARQVVQCSRGHSQFTGELRSRAQAACPSRCAVSTDLRQRRLQTPASPLSWRLGPGLAQGLVGLGLGLQEQPAFPSGRAGSFVLSLGVGAGETRARPTRHCWMADGSGGAGLVPGYPHSCNPSPELPEGPSPRPKRGPARGSALGELTLLQAVWASQIENQARG